MPLKINTRMRPQLKAPDGVTRPSPLISKADASYVLWPETEYRCKDECINLKSATECAILGSLVKIDAAAGSCDYYIHGGMTDWKMPVTGCITKDSAGYAQNPSRQGFGCKRCKWFDADSLDCYRGVDKESAGPAPGMIHPNGCCNLNDPDEVRGKMTREELTEFFDYQGYQQCARLTMALKITPKSHATAPRSDDDDKCECTCESCVAGNCMNCTNTECDDPDCPCEQDPDAKAKADMLTKIIAFQENRRAAIHSSRGGAPTDGKTIQSAVTDDGVLELFCYDDIGESFWSYGITVRDFRSKVENSPPFTSIRLRINSWGGDSFEGVTIGNYLKSLGKPIETVVDGIAASAASVIAMCGSVITMAANSMMMVHNASTGCYGYASDMRQTADVLDAVSGAVAQTYVARTGLSNEDVKALLDAETWMDAKTCLEKGFATRISETEKAADPEPAAATAKPVQSAHFGYRNVPAAAARPAMRASFKLRAASMTADLVQKMAKPAAGDSLDNLAGQTIELSAAESKAMFNSDTPVSLAVRNFSGSKDGARFKSLASGAGTAAKVSMLVVPYDGVLSSNLGGYREVYESGAFASGLADDPRVTFLHDEGKILGRVSAGTAKFWEDADGVHAECTTPEASWATDLLVSMNRGDINGSSAAFWILKDRWEMRGNQKVRIVEKALMREAAVHSFPAYETTEAGVEPGQVENHGEMAFQQQMNENRLRLLALEIL